MSILKSVSSEITLYEYLSFWRYSCQSKLHSGCLLNWISLINAHTKVLIPREILRSSSLITIQKWLSYSNLKSVVIYVASHEFYSIRNLLKILIELLNSTYKNLHWLKQSKRPYFPSSTKFWNKFNDLSFWGIKSNYL